MGVSTRVCPPVKQGKQTKKKILSSSAGRNKHLGVGGAAKKTLTVLFYRRRGERSLELKHRHVVGLVGLCNRILNTAVYRLFYRGDATGIFKRGRESLVLSPRV